MPFFGASDPGAALRPGRRVV